MFQLQKRLENVSEGYQLYLNNLFVCEDKVIVKYDVKTFTELKRSKEIIQCNKISIIGNMIITISNNEILYFDFDLTLIDRLFFEAGIGDFTISTSGKIVIGLGYDYSMFLPTSGIYDIINKEILWSGEKGDNIKIVNNEIFAISKSYINYLNKNDGTINWCYEFKEAQFLPTLHFGDNKNILVSFEGNTELQWVDGVFGNMLWAIEAFGKGILVDKKTNTIHQFMIGYGNYDLKTGKVIKKYTDRSYFSHIGIESQRSNFSLVDDLIITTDWKKGIAGAFDINQLEFKWLYSIENGNFPSNKEIRWDFPFLFMQDSNNNLYIFRKQSELL